MKTQRYLWYLYVKSNFTNELHNVCFQKTWTNHSTIACPGFFEMDVSKDLIKSEDFLRVLFFVSHHKVIQRIPAVSSSLTMSSSSLMSSSSEFLEFSEFSEFSIHLVSGSNFVKKSKSKHFQKMYYFFSHFYKRWIFFLSCCVLSSISILRIRSLKSQYLYKNMGKFT